MTLMGMPLQKMEFLPGDVAVIHCDRLLDRELREAIYADWHKLFPSVRLLVLDKGFTLGVMRHGEPDALCAFLAGAEADRGRGGEVPADTGEIPAGGLREGATADRVAGSAGAAAGGQDSVLRAEEAEGGQIRAEATAHPQDAAGPGLPGVRVQDEGGSGPSTHPRVVRYLRNDFIRPGGWYVFETDGLMDTYILGPFTSQKTAMENIDAKP
jgi:hypothetical protein